MKFEVFPRPVWTKGMWTVCKKHCVRSISVCDSVFSGSNINTS